MECSTGGTELCHGVQVGLCGGEEHTAPFPLAFRGLDEVVAFRKEATHLSGWLAGCCRVAALQQDLGDLPGRCACQAKALRDPARQAACATAQVSCCMCPARKCCFSLLMRGCNDNSPALVELQKLVLLYLMEKVLAGAVVANSSRAFTVLNTRHCCLSCRAAIGRLPIT